MIRFPVVLIGPLRLLNAKLSVLDTKLRSLAVRYLEWLCCHMTKFVQVDRFEFAVENLRLSQVHRQRKRWCQGRSHAICPCRHPCLYPASRTEWIRNSCGISISSISSSLSPPPDVLAEAPIVLIRAWDSSRSKSDLRLASAAAASIWPWISCWSSGSFQERRWRVRFFGHQCCQRGWSWKSIIVLTHRKLRSRLEQVWSAKAICTRKNQ